MVPGVEDSSHIYICGQIGDSCVGFALGVI